MSNPDPLSNMDWTPGECLRTAAEESDKHDVDACVALLLRRRPAGDGTSYDVHFLMSGLSISEAIALLDIEKARLLRHFTDPSGTIDE